MGYVIAIANEKGGVAKTTTAISLGSAIAEVGYKVLLVDLDSQANLTMALAIDNERITHTISKILLENEPLHKSVLETQIDGLEVIPAAPEISLAERFLPVRAGYQLTLRKCLSNGSTPYDFILLDCPPFLGAVTTNALTAADLLIMPTQAEFFSISALRNMMALVRKVRVDGNPALTYRLLLTLFDRRNRIHRTMAEQLRATFGNGVLETVIEVDTRLRESSAVGTPITLHSPKTRASLQYRALSQEILAYVQETIRQPA